MKNLIKLMLITTASAMLFAGCGSSAASSEDAVSEETTADVSADTVQVEDAVEELVEDESEADAADIATMTFEEYVNSNAEIKAQLDDVATQTGMKITAQGNSLVYEYTLDMEVADDQKDALSEQFDTAMTEQVSTFTDMKAELESETGLSGISIIINYVDSNGNLVYTTTF